jgi:hypothetical protein
MRPKNPNMVAHRIILTLIKGMCYIISHLQVTIYIYTPIAVESWTMMLPKARLKA